MLIPLALRGVKYRPQPAAAMLRRNLAIYGLGGVDRAVHRDQARRPDRHQTVAGLMRRQLLAGAADARGPHRAARRDLPARRHRHLAAHDVAPREREPRPLGRHGRGLRTARPGVRGRSVVPTAGPGSYDPTASGASNLGPNNPDLIDAVRGAVDALRKQDDVEAGDPIPADAVTTSGSSLDPDITPAYAKLQAPRVAAARGLGVQDVLAPHRPADHRADLRVPRRPAGQRPAAQPGVGAPSLGP